MMKYMLRLLLFIAIGLTMQVAYAQAYEQGSGIAGCQAGSGVCNGWQWQPYMLQPQQQAPSPPPPPVRWADRYGSVVIGVNSKGKGVLGASKDKITSIAATDAAIQDCESHGGHSCKISLTYHNQCIATASGVIASRSASAPTLEEAIQSVLEDCNSVSSECKIYYTACSMPVRIQ